MSIFESYVFESSIDEVFDSEKNIRKNWKDILENIEKSGLDVLQEKQADIDWHLEDNGVASIILLFVLIIAIKNSDWLSLPSPL